MFFLVLSFFSGVLAKVPPSLSCSDVGICFASGLSTGAVLQRAPEKATLFGSLKGSAGTTIQLRLVSTDGRYSKVFKTTASSDLTWRVTLDPMPIGGNYSATVSCTGCVGSSKKTISDLTFVSEFLISPRFPRTHANCLMQHLRPCHL